MTTADFRTLRWVDFFLYALSNPTYLYRQIEKNNPKPFALSFIIPAMVSFTEIMTISVIGEQDSFFFYKITFVWLMLFIVMTLNITMFASLMDMSAQFLGYSGNIREMISLINFSLFPRVFIFPVIYICTIGFFFAPNFVIVLYVIFYLGFFIWTSFVAIIGIAEMHDTGFGKALLIYSFPFLLIMFIFVFLFFLSFLLGLTYTMHLIDMITSF